MWDREKACESCPKTDLNVRWIQETSKLLSEDVRRIYGSTSRSGTLH